MSWVGKAFRKFMVYTRNPEHDALSTLYCAGNNSSNEVALQR
jgi:hypothetical protein